MGGGDGFGSPKISFLKSLLPSEVIFEVTSTILKNILTILNKV